MTPSPINLNSLNKNTARALISAILSSGGITRTELAKLCGVSAMTAGKAVSAMLCAGYATAEPEVSERSRVSDLIYPSERFRFLIFSIGTREMCAEIYDTRENTRFCYTQPRNHSVDVTTDASAFLSTVNEQLRAADADPDTYRLSALLYHKITKLDTSALARHGIDIFTDITNAAALYTKTKYPEECIAFVGVYGGADITVISDGKAINGKRAARKQRSKDALSELEMLDILSLQLSRLFNFITPDRVLIDSRSLHLSRRFASELYDRLEERTAMKKEELPELVTNDGIPFPSRAVIGQLIDIYAELMSAN